MYTWLLRAIWMSSDNLGPKGSMKHTSWENEMYWREGGEYDSTHTNNNSQCKERLLPSLRLGEYLLVVINILWFYAIQSLSLDWILSFKKTKSRDTTSFLVRRPTQEIFVEWLTMVEKARSLEVWPGLEFHLHSGPAPLLWASCFTMLSVHFPK